ncbi:thiamine pyrophosphate-binding protein [Coralliovum pocilloporae]|uniref:thiamine pyrophosphate-binding protein n=1 Tax=Coralliovum pocilloporae TaxID=3066369 RepID=UPI003306C495
MKTGGQLIVEALETHGVERVFCIPGESYLAVLDGLHDSRIETTVCRQEGGAAMMADAWGKLTGTPGICMVTRGPGATNAAAGVHIAYQDSTPMILFIGQIDSRFREREAFQEVDYRRFFSPMAKWVAEIDSAERVPEMISRAFHVATSGRPGPVVLALPEDALIDTADISQPAPWKPVETYPGSDQIADFVRRIEAAGRPLMILGGSRWSQDAVDQVKGFAERFSVPIACSFRRQMLFDHSHPLYAGDVGIGLNPKLRARIDESDCLILLGGRLSEMPSQSYELLDIPSPRQPFIHIHAGVEELGRVYRPDLAIHASPRGFASALAAYNQDDSIPQYSDWAESTHKDYLSWSRIPDSMPGDVHMGEIVAWLKGELPDDSILCNGAGNYATWIHRFWPFRRFATQAAPTSGSMGYGVPAAVAAKLLHPDRDVVAFAGDGCFQMTCQEFGTAVQAGAAVIVLVVDNGMYGTIRMHQEREYPARLSATSLINPDFAAWARSYGVFGATVEKTEEFADLFRAAKASNGPALLHIKIDPEGITPATTLSALREKALNHPK